VVACEFSAWTAREDCGGELDVLGGLRGLQGLAVLVGFAGLWSAGTEAEAETGTRAEDRVPDRWRGYRASVWDVAGGHVRLGVRLEGIPGLEMALSTGDGGVVGGECLVVWERGLEDDLEGTGLEEWEGIPRWWW